MDWKHTMLLIIGLLLILLLVCVVVWKIVRKLMPYQVESHASASTRVGAQATVPVLDELVLPQIGQYHIEKQIGRGAMGMVYRGIDPASGEKVAIKTMALELEFDAEQLVDARARFFREAETAAKLDHACIVKVLASGEDQGLAWIAMEYLEGESLQAWTRSDHLLPLSSALAVVRQIALALDYAHKQQVVHRDIKPANMMYEAASGKIKLTDFGVARMTDANRTRTGLVLGTPSFMSPEQLAGKHIDARSDLYSLGVTLYQLISGRLPFEGESLGQLMYAITKQEPADLSDLALPPTLWMIIVKALQKETTARFQSGAQFALALARLEASLKGSSDHA